MRFFWGQTNGTQNYILCNFEDDRINRGQSIQISNRDRGKIPLVALFRGNSSTVFEYWRFELVSDELASVVGVVSSNYEIRNSNFKSRAWENSL